MLQTKLDHCLFVYIVLRSFFWNLLATVWVETARSFCYLQQKRVIHDTFKLCWGQFIYLFFKTHTLSWQIYLKAYHSFFWQSVSFNTFSDFPGHVEHWIGFPVICLSFAFLRSNKSRQIQGKWKNPVFAFQGQDVWCMALNKLQP